VDWDAERAGDDLVAEADADYADARVGDGGAGEVDEGGDPLVVFEGRVFGSRDEDGVDIREVGVRGQVVDYIVAREGKDAVDRGRVYGADEEVLEDAVVAVVTGVDAREGRVGFEDGQAEEWRVHCFLGARGRAST
jgi:hypothetical protein